MGREVASRAGAKVRLTDGRMDGLTSRAQPTWGASNFPHPAWLPGAESCRAEVGVPGCGRKPAAGADACPPGLQQGEGGGEEGAPSPDLPPWNPTWPSSDRIGGEGEARPSAQAGPLAKRTRCSRERRPPPSRPGPAWPPPKPRPPFSFPASLLPSPPLPSPAAAPHIPRRLLLHPRARFDVTAEASRPLASIDGRGASVSVGTAGSPGAPDPCLYVKDKEGELLA